MKRGGHQNKRPLEATFLLAQKVDFNYEKKFHSIHHIRNEIQVDVFPAIILTDLWGRMLFNEETEIFAWLSMIDPEEEEVFTTGKQRMTNMRAAPLYPGMDLSMSIRFLAKTAGNYYIKLCTAHEEVSRAYLYITKRT